MTTDQDWMAQAIAQANTAQYRTRPNPAVGCVIVKNEQIIGRGATAPVGGSHAEVFALKEAGMQAKDATAYVTLEPCAHYGRTPPCAEALIKAGLKKVVIATLDPNPLVAGKGLAMLNDAGIETIVGVLQHEAQAQNRGFLKVMAGGLPYVRLKIAASLDGRTAMASGESKWITGEAARQDVQHWRAISGAVITGIQTILADDAQLNVRNLLDVDLSEVVQPWRVILDRHGQLPLQAKILRSPATVMVMGPYREELAQLGVVQFEPQSLTDLLSTLKSAYKIYDVLVEAGATLSTSFLQDNLVDEVIQYIAPMYLGQTARALNQLNYESMQQRFQLKLLEVKQIHQDIRLRLQPVQHCCASHIEPS
ncbi:bifunctional diaminohydroxyphosphoribosylaminopyrimidine deaminase/5-amino-6-(5-phosphoribosylamino)uracil reductase RibD [Acinetobacter qingfengensis]|uniref:Riboflavin biosynthesis protein RibD n=1 Tax=Acinetobacter qingfengensis TaxID=1262585 RepID=A0A1E7RCZ3_9GAMM|nr:bifunctional diaminohydroxyphosphoribosylaminopyrimidine deaminase/5-amino-6-(5-phosphoribosylamino)uracil reductase RibD [Acinetobacter qingfengensis]KAA8732139.1 bifunctional diaminohydroxyphosphoribosylaminopyrimidine deaminase/5-amino-6-(5-phosphoribosylamino)uracil reductase RibD [Acinetobacter qingfengensis]OEY97218.1 riboflavin biosynthesis protein RibD [Acinetobacter qingfengensis]